PLPQGARGRSLGCGLEHARGSRVTGGRAERGDTMPQVLEVTAHEVSTAGHTTFYLACGPEDGPLVVCVHGWPELSRSWRHQLPVLGALGFRAVAPDMRGYGRSTVYP